MVHSEKSDSFSTQSQHAEDGIIPFNPKLKTPKVENMKKHHSEKPARHQVNYRVDDERYEFIKRLSVAMPKGTIQKVIDSRIFSRDWRGELEDLRKTQRRQGRRDREFIYPKLLRAIGYVIPPGPGRDRKLKKAA